jgi:hypothetical protein
VALEKAPDRRATTSNPLLVHRRNHFFQSQIRLRGDEIEQPARVVLQR